MNSNVVSETKRIALACDPAIPYGFLDETTMWADGWLIFIAVINIVACPLTAVMNALVIIAVKTTHRLKTKSNIALACLWTTDLTMGVIGQPAFIAWVIAQLQGNSSSTYCIKTVLSRLALRVLDSLTLSHLAMVHVERYIAIKHSLQYETVVTEDRLVCLSALLWIILLPLIVPFSFLGDKIISIIVDVIIISLFIATVFVCQVVLYYETSRHKKQIATQQVSSEAREKFLRENKAFKLTATVFFCLILCYLPLVVVIVTLPSNFFRNSVNLGYTALSTGLTAAVFNSVANPFIYCVSIRQFRVAFIQLVFRKSNADAQNMEKRAFGRLNRVVLPHQEGS